jgi:hypothetical protein
MLSRRKALVNRPDRVIRGLPRAHIFGAWAASASSR